MKSFFKVLAFLFLTSFSSVHAENSNPRLHVITVASNSNTGLRQLKYTCKKQRVQLHTLGLNKPYKGHCQKLVLLSKHIQELSDTDIVLFIDAYDVLVLSDAKTILNKFIKFNRAIVFSAELNCFPDAQLAREYPSSPTPFKYLNSGSYIGYVHSLKKMFNEIGSYPENEDDQRVLTNYFLSHQENCALDYFCDLFMPLFEFPSSSVEIDTMTRSVRCLATGSSPCVVHGNGISGKVLYQTIFDRLFGKLPMDRNKI